MRRMVAFLCCFFCLDHAQEASRCARQLVWQMLTGDNYKLSGASNREKKGKKRNKKGENVHQTYPKVCVCVLHLVNVRPQKEGDGMLPLLLIGNPPFVDCFPSLSRTFTLIMIKLADSGTQQLARAQ